MQLRPALAVLGVAATLAMATPARAEGQQAYHLGMLPETYRGQLMQRVDSYALVETFLKACGRPPALESRLRRLVRGCIEPATVNMLAQHYRRALAARAHHRWDCVSASGRQMIARSEDAIRLTVADVTRLCQTPR
ncbi:hypothetical protein E8L99_02750 [Phreatobacter aquaticus]|uniref:Uncharacterized protein n=1 Tax=Phreatobacter aquaticus TaxID=2570229 RepID=A0A4D7QDN6_9HYPH|nr:hypothetical protein [Phreatobacter aquaticus]QCK84775.1 hypothetical protein E8L99_02750 [Phreatobacter aquaticus]